jgi:hypothetical protein
MDFSQIFFWNLASWKSNKHIFLPILETEKNQIALI